MPQPKLIFEITYTVGPAYISYKDPAYPKSRFDCSSSVLYDTVAKYKGWKSHLHNYNVLHNYFYFYF